MTDIRICFSYTHTDAPSDGSNNFTRALRQHISRETRFKIVDNLNGDYELLFMNQLGRSPGIPYALSEIRAALGGEKNRKVVVRAINLSRNCHPSSPSGHTRRFEEDGPILDLLNMADFVIFQSAFQKSFFDEFGYKGMKYAVIHNGAAPVFLDVPGTVKKLQTSDDLILFSSAMSISRDKRQDMIAAFSFLPGVKVIHSGAWPEGLDHGKVEMAGVLPHDKLVQLYKRGHYFLHPANRDVCPNSLIEGLCAGLPAIYNPGLGSGSELARKFGISLDENDLPGTIARARGQYDQLASALAAERQYYSIDRAASSYMSVFKTVAQG